MQSSDRPLPFSPSMAKGGPGRADIQRCGDDGGSTTGYTAAGGVDRANHRAAAADQQAGQQGSGRGQGGGGQPAAAGRQHMRCTRSTTAAATRVDRSNHKAAAGIASRSTETGGHGRPTAADEIAEAAAIMIEAAAGSSQAARRRRHPSSRASSTCSHSSCRGYPVPGFQMPLGVSPAFSGGEGRPTNSQQEASQRRACSQMRPVRVHRSRWQIFVESSAPTFQQRRRQRPSVRTSARRPQAKMRRDGRPPRRRSRSYL